MLQPSGAVIAAGTALGACILLWASYPSLSAPYDSLSTSLDLNHVLDVASNSLSWSSSSTDLEDEEYQLSTYKQSFPDFLSVYPENDLIWLTLADKFFSETCTTHLQHFVKSLRPYTSPVLDENGRSRPPRKHRLITLCIDPGCMKTCEERNWTCYGEYELSRPEIIFPSTWPKLAGALDNISMCMSRSKTSA